jgi:hypothetical protein
MIFTLNLRTLRPLRLCGRYSEFRLRLSRSGSFGVNIFFLTWLRLLQSYTTFLLLFDSPLHSVRSLGNRCRAPCRVPRFARTQCPALRSSSSSHVGALTGESPVAKSCKRSLTSSMSSIRLSISNERERAGSWTSPWRAQARYFSASLSQVSGFFG